MGQNGNKELVSTFLQATPAGENTFAPSSPGDCPGWRSLAGAKANVGVGVPPPPSRVLPGLGIDRAPAPAVLLRARGLNPPLATSW